MTKYNVLQPIDSQAHGLLTAGAIYEAELTPEMEAALISAGIIAAPKQVAGKESKTK